MNNFCAFVNKLVLACGLMNAYACKTRICVTERKGVPVNKRKAETFEMFDGIMEGSESQGSVRVYYCQWYVG